LPKSTEEVVRQKVGEVCLLRLNDASTEESILEELHTTLPESFHLSTRVSKTVVDILAVLVVTLSFGPRTIQAVFTSRSGQTSAEWTPSKPDQLRPLASQPV
jgi:hypothetical protein